uniref:3-hydroxyacyl-CoA dehydrogenase, mitochondrial n=1 Tax=Triatoma infestans TaxID=30076 RepID=A0A161MEK6_TRIIF
MWTCYLQKTMSLIFSLISRGFASSTMASAAIKNVTVVGGGLMGSGIAQVAAQAGNDVVLVDISENVLGKAKSAIQKNLSRVAKKKFKDDSSKIDEFIKKSMDHLKFSVDLTKTAENSDTHFGSYC